MFFQKLNTVEPELRFLVCSETERGMGTMHEGTIRTRSEFGKTVTDTVDVRWHEIPESQMYRDLVRMFVKALIFVMIKA